MISLMKYSLHPSIGKWFKSCFDTLTDVQQLALPETTEGRNVLILAPTGSGKTLAAFLSVLSKLAELAEARQLPNATVAVYVSPLKALGRDLQRNLEPAVAAVNDGLAELQHIRMELRTGDTANADRSRMQRRRPHLLLTTPESLSSLLSQTGWREGFEPQVVVVDEIHSFAENKRGSLLSLCLERLERRSPARQLQRIGISATAHPMETVQRLLCGDRLCSLASVDIARASRLVVADLPANLRLPPAGFGPARTVPMVAERVAAAQCSLIFTSTRSAAEELGLHLKQALPEFADRIDVHHGSIDRESRLEVEDRLARGEMKAVVCSSSLEMGVDFQAVDQVLLIGTPRGVSRTLQRLGRSGHRVNGVAEGALIPVSLPDLLECTAVCDAARHGRLDALRVPRAPLDVLAQVLLGMSIERTWAVDEAFHLVRRAGPYQELPRPDFDAVLTYLAGGGRVLGPYGTYGKIVIENGEFRVADKKVARDYFQNIGAISDEFHVRVVSRGNRRLGEVEEGFLASLQPGEPFVLGGKTVRLRALHRDLATVEPVDAERAVTPRWMGGKMPLSARLAEEEIRLRRALREAWAEGGTASMVERLELEWRVPSSVAARIAEYAGRQARSSAIAADVPVQVEWIRRKRNLVILFHSVAGRAVNRSLAWVVGARFARSQTRTPSVVAHFDDHAFLLSIDARLAPEQEQLRSWFGVQNWRETLESALQATETLGRKFRSVAEIGQLLPRRTLKGPVSSRASSWSGSLLYTTLMKYEPDHPLVREALREVLDDQLDAEQALLASRRIHESEWEVFELPAPSPFALPLFAFFQREILMTQDPDQALEEVSLRLYENWASPDPEPASCQ